MLMYSTNAGQDTGNIAMYVFSWSRPKGSWQQFELIKGMVSLGLDEVDVE